MKNFFTNFLNKTLLPFSQKMVENRYLKSIRDGFALILPLIIAGSFFTLINNLIVGDTGLTMKLFNTPLASVQAVGNSVVSATMNIISLLLVFTISSSLAKQYQVDGTIYGTTALVTFFILMPVGVNEEVGGEIVETSYLGSQAMFMTFIVAFGTVELLRFLSSFEKLKIKMPDSVPPAIAKSFNGLIPSIMVVVVFAVIRFFTDLYGTPLNDIIFEVLQKPFTSLVSSAGGIVVIYFFYMLLWGLGIHSAS